MFGERAISIRYEIENIMVFRKPFCKGREEAVIYN
jgi:hypothetical protein